MLLTVLHTDHSDEEESSPEPTTKVPSKSLTPITLMEPTSVNHDDFEVENAAYSGNGGSTFPETPKKASARDEVSYGHSGRGFDPDGEQATFSDDPSSSL